MMIDVYHAADLPKIAATAGLHTTAAVIEGLAREYQDRIKIVRMDVAENHKIPARFGIRGVPALILFKQGEAKQTLREPEKKRFVREETQEPMRRSIPSGPMNFMPGGSTMKGCFT